MAAYRFRTTNASGRAGIVEFQVNSEEEVELVRSFMLRLAPEMAAACLRANLPASDCAERTIFWAMHLVARYRAFEDEALRAIETQNAAETRQQAADPETYPSGKPGETNSIA
jgi:hypothetical protein